MRCFNKQNFPLNIPSNMSFVEIQIPLFNINYDVLNFLNPDNKDIMVIWGSPDHYTIFAKEEIHKKLRIFWNKTKEETLEYMKELGTIE